MIMYVVFDLDDTLYDLMEPFQRVHNELFAARTEVPCQQLFLSSRRYSDEAFYQWAQGLISKKEEFAYRIRKTYEAVEVTVSEEEIQEFEVKYRAYQKEIHLPEEMILLLEDLKMKGIPMAILSNGKEKDQWEKVKALGITNWIPEEKIFISENLPAPKPDIRAFQTVEQKLHLNPEYTWFVGDTYEVDIVGAQKAGWHTIWYNHRKKNMPSGGVAPDYETKNMEKLRNMIQKIIGNL